MDTVLCVGDSKCQVSLLVHPVEYFIGVLSFLPLKAFRLNLVISQGISSAELQNVAK